MPFIVQEALQELACLALCLQPPQRGWREVEGPLKYIRSASMLEENYKLLWAVAFTNQCKMGSDFGWRSWTDIKPKFEKAWNGLLDLVHLQAKFFRRKMIFTKIFSVDAGVVMSAFSFIHVRAWRSAGTQLTLTFRQLCCV